MGNTNKRKNAREHFRLSVQWHSLLNSQWLILCLNKKQRCHRHSNSLVLTIFTEALCESTDQFDSWTNHLGFVNYTNWFFGMIQVKRRICSLIDMEHICDTLLVLVSFRYLASFYQRFPSKCTEPHTTCIKNRGNVKGKMREQISKSWNQIHYLRRSCFLLRVSCEGLHHFYWIIVCKVYGQHRSGQWFWYVSKSFFSESF